MSEEIVMEEDGDMLAESNRAYLPRLFCSLNACMCVFVSCLYRPGSHKL